MIQEGEFGMTSLEPPQPGQPSCLLYQSVIAPLLRLHGMTASTLHEDDGQSLAHVSKFVLVLGHGHSHKHSSNPYGKSCYFSAACSHEAIRRFCPYLPSLKLNWDLFARG